MREHPQITGVMIGEGEKTFCELAEYYAGESRRDKEKQKIQETQRTGEGKSTEERSKPGEIPGIAYRSGDEIIFTAPREMLDLSDIPFCYDKAGDFKNRIIYYESSRGCPFSCSYCLSSVEKQLRFRDAELVKKELQFFIDREVPQVKFVDRTFNCNHAHAMEIWSYIKEHDNGITEFSEDGIDEIINSYNGDIEPLVDRIQAVLDAGADYQTYTDIADGVNGSVKFIIKTDAVKAED